MTDLQVVMMCATFAMILAALALHYVRWIPPGKFKVALTFAFGAAAIAAMYVADIPPDWFEGGATGFSLAVFLLMWAFVSDEGEARSFGRPLLLGMAAALLIANVVAHV